MTKTKKYGLNKPAGEDMFNIEHFNENADIIDGTLENMDDTLKNHTHNYAGSSSAGGSANSAEKLNTANAGSTSQPVYFKDGKPVACTLTIGSIDIPVYVKDGVITPVGKKFSDYLPKTGGIVSGEITAPKFIGELQGTADNANKFAGLWRVGCYPGEPNRIWGCIPFVDGNGVMEFGQHIDFHCAGDGGKDHCSRLSATDNEDRLRCTGDFYAGHNLIAENALVTQNSIYTGGCSVENTSVSLGYGCVATGYTSSAVGYAVVALGNQAHAEGHTTQADGDCSHAEGYTTNAAGYCSHAEGNDTKAGGSCSHAEGYWTRSLGNSSHTEGINCVVNVDAVGGHAEGHTTQVDSMQGHTQGYGTYVNDNVCCAMGTFNKPQPGLHQYMLVVGNGSDGNNRSNCMSLLRNGSLNLSSTLTTSTTADYAEFFEWEDGNTNNEDRVGRFVTLNGNKIKIAKPGDYILGIVSGRPCVLGNADCDSWNKMYLTDEFNRYIYEPNPKLVYNKKTHDMEEAKDSEGNPIYEGERLKLNPEYDTTKEYISRRDRPEWAPIGMLGVLAVYHDGTCEVNGYCKCSENGTATACNRNEPDSYRVIEKVTDHIVKVILK